MANVTIQQDPSFLAFMNAGDVLTGIIDGTFLAQPAQFTLVVPVGGQVNHLDASATGTTRKIVLRSGTNFVCAGHTRVIELRYGSPDGGVTFFWIQPE